MFDEFIHQKVGCMGTYLNLGGEIQGDGLIHGISKIFNLYQHLQGGVEKGGVLGWKLEEKGARRRPLP